MGFFIIIIEKKQISGLHLKLKWLYLEIYY
jgi:hypothetical protein